MNNRIMKVFVVPGGREPERAHPDDAGLDLFVRAVVDDGFDSDCPQRRKTVFNFFDFPKDSDAVGKIYDAARDGVDPFFLALGSAVGRKLAFRVLPGESVAVRLGVVLELPDDCVAYVNPRGSTVNSFKKRKCRLEIGNDTVPIDPTFRGELWAEIVNHGPEPFFLGWGMRLVQLVVLSLARPNLVVVSSADELSYSARGIGCNGSTGV